MTCPTLSIEWFWPFALSHLPEDPVDEIGLRDAQATGLAPQQVEAGLEESQVNINGRQSSGRRESERTPARAASLASHADRIDLARQYHLGRRNSLGMSIAVVSMPR